MRDVKAVLLSVLLPAAAGCATVAHGTRQDVHVTSDPAGAQVSVLTAPPGKPEILRNANAGMTPLVLSLTRRDAHIVLRFSTPGCTGVDVRLTRTTSGWIWGNAVLANPYSGQGADSATSATSIYVGQAAAISTAVAVDVFSGAAYKLPKRVHATMCK
jgi:hypothetical protein